MAEVTIRGSNDSYIVDKDVFETNRDEIVRTLRAMEMAHDLLPKDVIASTIRAEMSGITRLSDRNARDAALQGVTNVLNGNANDESAAAFRTAGEVIRGETGLDRLLDSLNRNIDQVRSENEARMALDQEAASIGELTGIGLSMILPAGAARRGVGASAASSLPFGANRVQRGIEAALDVTRSGLRTGVVGAGIGGASQFAAGEGGLENRLQQGYEGAAFGAGTGFVMGAGTQAAQKAGQAIMNRGLEGEKTLAAAMSQAKTNPEDVMANLRPGETPLTATQPFPNSAPAGQVVGERVAAAPEASKFRAEVERLSTEAVQGVRNYLAGNVTKRDFGQLSQALEEGTSKIQPHWDEAYKLYPAQTFAGNKALEEVLQRPAVKDALDRATTLIRNRGGQPFEAFKMKSGDFKEVPTIETLHRTIGELKPQFGESPAQGAAISQAKKELTTILKDSAPELKRLINKQAIINKIDDAAGLGQKYGSTRFSKEELKMYNSLDDGQKIAFRAGFWDTLKKNLDTPQNVRNFANKYLEGEYSGQALDTILTPEQRSGVTAAFRDFKKTADTLSSIKKVPAEFEDLTEPGLIEGISRAAQSRLAFGGGAVVQTTAARQLAGRKGFSPKQVEALTKILTETAPEKIGITMQTVSRLMRTRQPTKLRDYLLGIAAGNASQRLENEVTR